MTSFQEFYKAWVDDILRKAYNVGRREKVTVRFTSGSLQLGSARYTSKNLISIPPRINPLHIYTPRSDSIVAFFYSYSPLSNHYLSPFIIAGKTFNCVEQYIMYRKARLFFDNKIAESILLEPNPVHQKRLGRQVRGFTNYVWRQEAFLKAHERS